jgi:hypothetical protein
MMVIIEDQQEETRYGTGFHSQPGGTLPPREFPWLQRDPRPYSSRYNRRETRSLGYGFYGIKYNNENLKYEAKQIRTAKKPTSKPRSWQHKTKERDNWQNARGSRRGRPRRRRQRMLLNKDRRTYLDGSRWQ